MKTHIMISILSLYLLSGYGQDPSLPSDQGLIVLQNNKKIKSARLWKIDDNKVEYELNGSLHDVQLDQIKAIKLENEIVSFDIHGQIAIRPYDLIISGRDTIKCLITHINSGNIYFFKHKGFQKADYISQSMVDRYYKHPEDLIFQSFQDEYISFVTGATQTEEGIEISEEFVHTQEDGEDQPIYETVPNQTIQPPGAGRVVGQVLVGTVLGAAGTVAGALGGGIALGLVGAIGGSAGVGALIGGGLGAAAGLGLGTGLGVTKVGNQKDVKGKFGSAVGGAYLGLLGSIVFAVVTGGTGIGLVLIVASPAVVSTIVFTKSRRLKKDSYASHQIESNNGSQHL